MFTIIAVLLYAEDIEMMHQGTGCERAGPEEEIGHAPS